MMSAAAGQDLSVLGSCEESRDHLRAFTAVVLYRYIGIF